MSVRDRARVGARRPGRRAPGALHRRRPEAEHLQLAPGGSGRIPRICRRGLRVGWRTRALVGQFSIGPKRVGRGRARDRARDEAGPRCSTGVRAADRQPGTRGCGGVLSRPPPVRRVLVAHRLGWRRKWATRDRRSRSSADRSSCVGARFARTARSARSSVEVDRRALSQPRRLGDLSARTAASGDSLRGRGRSQLLPTSRSHRRLLSRSMRVRSRTTSSHGSAI